MKVKILITPYEHSKKHTFSVKEAITLKINNCYRLFVNWIFEKKQLIRCSATVEIICPYGKKKILK